MSDKSKVHKSIRRLMKSGVWLHVVNDRGALVSLVAGPVEIRRWESSDNVNVLVGGRLICDSNSSGWGELGSKALGFFRKHRDRLRATRQKETLAEAAEELTDGAAQ